MAKNIVNITSTSTGTFIGNVVRNRELTNWFATLAAWGTFGGTTVTFFISPDGGTTLIPIYDGAYNAVSYTANSMANSVVLGNSSHNTDRLGIYVKLTGGSGINLNVGFYDNN